MTNPRVVINPNLKNNDEFHRSLKARGKGAKDYPNTHTEIEYLGDGKFGASISVGHRVFFDKADGNKPKKHKLTDERPSKDCVLIQSAKCCVEVHPYYAKYYDVQHEEVRLYEERWVVQRWRDPPGKWFDVGAWNPVIAVEEYPEPAGDVVKVIVTYDTDYGVLTVEYFQRDGNNLKHNVTFRNTSGSTETFRVLQRWAGIVGTKCNGKDAPVVENTPFFAFHQADKPQKKFSIAENLSSMVFDAHHQPKTEKCLQRPVSIEAHTQGMKADFIYAQWVLAQDESLVIDPDTATLDNPTEDGVLMREGESEASYAAARTACLVAALGRNTEESEVSWGGAAFVSTYYSVVGRAYVEWAIATLAGKTLTANPIFKYHGKFSATTSGEINPISGQPSEASDADLDADIASGTAYVDPFNVVVAANQSQDLGASAKTDLQAAMDAEQSWFAIGFQSPDDECPSSELAVYTEIWSEDKTDAATPKPTLYVEYTAVPTTAYKDIATRFKLNVQTYKDIATRFKLWAQNYKDIATHFKLFVQGYSDIAARFKLTVQSYKDIATRFLLTVGVQAYKDTSTRFKLTVQSYQDIVTRFQLTVQGYKDITTRFRLIVQNYQDITTRFRLFVQNYQDIATRFILNVKNYQDIATRFKLTVQAYQDITTLFNLIAGIFTDIATRFKLSVQTYQDVSTRFFLCKPTWEEIQIQKAVANLAMKIAELEVGPEPKAHFRI